MGLADFVGSRGEAIAFARLIKIYQRDGDLPYFWPHYLGEKCRTFDFLVEVIEPGPVIPFFFAQVKTTRLPLTEVHEPPRLSVRVDGEDLARMIAYPAPTYIIGVHEPSERTFVAAPSSLPSSGVRSMTTAHEFGAATMHRLRDEVRDYWKARGREHISSF